MPLATKFLGGRKQIRKQWKIWPISYAKEDFLEAGVQSYGE